MLVSSPSTYRNNLSDVGCCDELDRRLFLRWATEILVVDCFKIISEKGLEIERKMFDWFCHKVLVSLDNTVTLQDLVEVPEQLLLAACRGESDLDYYLEERLLENLHKEFLKRVLRFHELEVRVLEKEVPATGFDYCTHRIHLLHQLERKLNERRQRLRIERHERQSMLHLQSPHGIYYQPKYSMRYCSCLPRILRAQHMFTFHKLKLHCHQHCHQHTLFFRHASHCTTCIILVLCSLEVFIKFLASLFQKINKTDFSAWN